MSEEKKQELKEAIVKINRMVEEDEDARALIIVGGKERTLTSIQAKDAESIITTLSNALNQNENLMIFMITAISIALDYQNKEKEQKE